MKTKIKRFSKSTVSILLSLMMLFSCVVTSGAVTVQPERTAVTLDAASENAAVELDSAANADDQTTEEPVALENEKLNADIHDSGANVDIQRSGTDDYKKGGAIIYFKKALTNWWLGDGAITNVYIFNSDTSCWLTPDYTTVSNTEVGYFTLPNGTWTNYIIVRHDPSKYNESDPSFDSKWTQTENLSFRGSKNYLTSRTGDNYRADSYIIQTSTAAIEASTNAIVEGQTVTFTKSLSTNSNFNEIKNTTYTVTGGTEGTDYTKTGDTITFNNSGTYTVSATVTYVAKGFAEYGATKNATTNTETITVTANSGYLYTINQTGGTVSDVKVNNVADNTGAANEGDVITFKVTPPEGCVAKVEADDGTRTTLLTPTNGTYSYTMPAADVTINITYSYTVYFYNDVLDWSNVKVHAWDLGDNPVMGQWPGTALSNPTNNIYTVTLPSTAVGVVFNNNGSPQTVNINDVASNKGGTWIIKNSTDGSGNYQGNWGRTVTCNTAENGSVSVTSGYVVNPFARQNGIITLTTAPEEGYYASNVTVTGASGTVVAVTKTAANTYQFTMPDENVTVTPAFAESVTYSSITAKAQYSDNGSAYTDTVQGNVKINGGTVAVTVNAGEYAALKCDRYITINNIKYQFYKWVASASGTFTNESARETNFTPSASNEVATAQYKRLYNITWEPVTGGTISAQTPVMVGENYTVTITPDDGYELTSNSIDGSLRTLTNNAYTAKMPTHDVTVSAVFTKITYNRIYFYDAFEWGYTHIYFWETGNNKTEKNNTGWPGIAMTPDEEYINLYYIDLPTDVSFNKCIFNNITCRYNPDGGTQNIGGQTSEIIIDSVSAKNGQVYVPTQYNAGTWSSLSTLINNNTLKQYGDPGYYRIYFYNKNNSLCNLFNDTMANAASSNGAAPVYPKARGNTYVQFGKRTDGDTKTVSFYSYDSSAANMSADFNLHTFAGKAMTPMARSSNYNSGDMFFVDIPVNSNMNFVRFARAYPDNGHNMTKLYDFNASTHNNQYFQITNDNSASGKDIYDTGYDDSHKITGDAYVITEVLMDGNWGGTYQESIPEPEMNDPSSTQARVYAKTGTVRGSYDKYARLAEVSLSYTDGTVISASNKAYYHAYRENGGTTNFYKVEKANIEKNKEFQTTITIKSGYRDKYRVEAFIVNGETVYPSYANESSGIYTCKYTINDKQTTPVEITPVYFYRTAGARPAAQTAYQPSGMLPYDDEFITFYVENFESVKSKWGNTLSCYTWYDNDDEYESQAKSDPTNSTNYVKPTLGGYPGQPMIYRDGSYYTQIPKYNDDPDTATRKGVMGVTLNNFYWDDIHKNLAGNSEIGGSSGYNCQTYDYDDFTALVDAEGNELDDIIFTFKYNTGGASRTATVGKTNENDRGNKPINYVFDNNHEVDTSATTTNSLGANGANDGTNTVVASGNKYEVLTDYYGNPITLFGTKITAKTCSQIIDENFTDKLYIVSDGYTTAEHDYIGYFSTKWFVYNNEGTLLGALPPSAFYNDKWTNYSDFLKYSVNAGNVYKADGTDGTGNTDAEAAYQTYQYLVENYNNKPVVICYESDIYGEGRVVKSDGAWRCDGRWFYSKIGEKIEASVLIEYSDDNGTTWVRDTPVSGEPYKGSHTTAEAYFTGTGVPEKEVSLTNQDKSDTDKFNFTADLMKLVMRNGEPVIYQFKGWYYTQGADSYKAVEDTVYNPVTESVSGTRAKTSSAVFIARYEPMESADKVRFSHRPYTERLNNYTGQPDVGKGTGNTAISVRILDSTGNPIRIINKTEGIPELLFEELTQANAAYVEVTLYNTNVNEVIGGVYRDTLSSSTGYTIMYGSGTAATPEWVTTGDVKSDLSTSSNELVYIYNTSFFLQDNAIKDNMHIMNYYSNYKIPNSLVITHNLLETVVTDDNMLSTIVDESGNQITPHHDFFNTKTKITVKVLDSSNSNDVVKTFATTLNEFNLKTADLVEGSTDYKSSGYTLQIILAAETNGEEFQPENVTGDALAEQFGFYNYRDSKYNHSTEYLLNAKGTAATPTYASDSNIHTYTYTYTIPITDLYDNTTNDFVVGSLDFFSDPFKRITAEVKYYDRDVSPDSHSKPTDINKTATTVEILYDVSYKNTIAGFNSEAISPKFSEMNNILDEHCYWITQSAAVEGIGNKKDFHNSTNKSTSTTGAGVKLYKDTYIDNELLAYHTDFYGRTSTNPDYGKSNGTLVAGFGFTDKWVTYKDSEGFAIPENDNLNVSFGFDTISSVTIWCYNKPKEYSFTAYYVSPTTKQDSTEEDLDATTLVLTEDDKESVTNNGDPTYMYIVNPVKVGCKSINKTGFYNQRLGIPDANGNTYIDGYCDYLAAYGITNPYFGITGCDDDGIPIENDKLTGLEVKAVKYAKASENAESNAYEFDGWYIQDQSGYHKISSERFYQNRVVSNIVLYAGYRKIPQLESTVGVAVSLNGVDHYVDTDNVRKVRFNTQFNIFGGNVKDDDPNIQNVAAIYMTMPTKDASDNPIDWKNDTYNKALRDVLIDQQSAIRTQLEWHRDLLQAKLSSCDGYSVVDSKTGKDWYHTYTYPDLASALNITGFEYSTEKPNKIKFDWYAYEVVSKDPDKTNHKVTLTNKNRIQFYKVFDEATYEKTPIIAYVAVKYNDIWYISDNFVSNITYKHKGNEIYFPDYVVEDSTGANSNLETPFTEILNQDMFKRSYEDEIGLEDNGVYIDFTNDYEEEELPLDVLLE